MLPRLELRCEKFIELTKQIIASLDFLFIFHQGKRKKKPIILLTLFIHTIWRIASISQRKVMYRVAKCNNKYSGERPKNQYRHCGGIQLNYNKAKYKN